MMTKAEFKRLRKKLDWSQTEAAARLGVTYFTIRRWEEGTSRISGPAERLMELFIQEMDEQERNATPQRP